MADRAEHKKALAPDAALDVGECVFIAEPLEQYISDENNVAALRELMVAGQIVVFRRFASPDELSSLRAYLHRIQLASIPNFVPISHGAANNYRINFDDERAQVRAWFHVWSFFTWNQDLFNLYERYRSVYHLRNLVCGLPPATFLQREPELGCAARLSVQFYPSGKGYFSAHTDPYDVHQLVVPIMSMSKRGADFETGGNYLVRLNGERIYTEDMTEPGDILLFNARCTHGVETIDAGQNTDPMSAKGRWIMLFAVNKVAGNTAIGDATPHAPQGAR